MSNTTPTREASEVLADEALLDRMIEMGDGVSNAFGSLDMAPYVEPYLDARNEVLRRMALASISPTPPAVGEGEASVRGEAITPGWCLRMAELEGNAEIGAGAIDHPLRALATLRPSPDAIREPGTGWVYFNPYTGEEYAPNHPIESGEVPEATGVRRATAMEDHLHSVWQAALATPEGRTTDKGEG